MRDGGRGRGRGGGGGGGRGSGRRDARGASRDDRDRRGDGRPEYRPRRSPSLDRRARRPRSPDDDVRAVPRSGRMEYGGGYHDRDRPRGARADYGGGRDPSPGGWRFDYDDPRDVPGRGRRDCGGDRDGSRRYPSPRDYGRAPYRQDRYDRIGRGGDRDPIGSYEALPAYMLPDHPTDQGRSYLRAGKKEDDYLGGPSDRSFNRDSKYFGGPRHRSIDKESEFFGDGGTLKISVTESGRTSSLYQDCGSPQRVALPPPPLYPSVPPTEIGFLTGGSSMELGDGFGSGKSRSLHDGGRFKNREHFIDPYVRETKRDFLGSRDVLLEKDGGTDRLYPVVDMPLRRDRETDRLYSSRDILGSDLGTQVKQIGDSSSSLLVEGQPYRMHTEPGYEPSNGYNMDGFGRLSHDSLGHGSGHAHRFSGGSLEHGSDHGDEALLDIARHAHSKHEPRSESLEYDAHEYARRGLYVASENLPGNVSQNSRHISGSASLRGLKDERINHHRRLSHRMEEDEDSFQAIHHDMEHNMRPSYEGEASVHYQPARSSNDRYSHSPGTEPIGFARRSVHHELASFEYGHDLSDQEVSPMVSRKRYRSPAYHDRDMDMHQADGFTGHGYYSDDMDAYDLSSPRMSRRYDIDQMVDDEDGYDAGYDMRTSRDVFSRLALPHEIHDEWADVDHENHPHLVHGRPNHKPMSQRLSIPNAHSQFGGPYIHGRGSGRGRGRGRGLAKSAKKRMRMSLHQFNDGYTPERSDITRPNKFSKSSEDDPNGSEVNHEDAPEDEDLPMQKDPPEGSEEFSRQVHQAFLKYAKILNESQAMQKRFLDAPKGSLSCCVCGSVARKFPDVDALLTHAYDTCKVGLKTKHLGFHKALCLLMGWNWHVAPDTAKAHHYIQAEEVNAMKGDLILWPPVVVIHNSSIANKTKDTEAKVVSIEEIKGVVADIGVACGKVKVSHGRPANQSVFLVKFQPTISGFQEAMRVHGHFATRNHGKEEFQQMKSGKGKQAVPIHKLEELLYAHIGVAEDLGYLDEETKKRCVIRSKKDTQATADAALNLEP